MSRQADRAAIGLRPAATEIGPQPLAGRSVPMVRRRRRPRAMLLQAFCAAAVSFFVVTNPPTISTAVRGVGRAGLGPIVAGVALSFIAMANRGLLNHAAHHAVGLAPTRLEMTRTTAVGFAANKILRSGGASGLAVFLRHGRRRNFPGARVTAGCLIASLSSLAALGALLATAITLVALTSRLSGWWIAAAAGFSIYGLAIVGTGRAALRNERTLEAVWARAQRLRNRLTRRGGDVDITGVREVHAALTLARANVAWSRRAAGHAVLSKALGAAMLLAAAAAVGISVSPTGAIIIYATALAASFASIVPAGIGVVEASTGAMLVADGAPVTSAVAAVALYRIFDLWLPVLSGAILGRRELQRPPRPAAVIERETVQPGPRLVAAAAAAAAA